MPKTTAVVTRGAGFIGSHVVDALLAEGKRVVVVDDLSTGSVDHVAAQATLESDRHHGWSVARPCGGRRPADSDPAPRRIVERDCFGDGSRP
jgi:nucleoside-diphosphate-sugar epimerase